MAFFVKDFTSITAAMVQAMRGTQKRVTDFRVGAVCRTMLEAVATPIETVYVAMVTGLREALPIATFRTFGFTGLPARAATGLVRVTLTAQAAPVTVLAGAQFARADQTPFRTQQDVTIAPGTTQVDFRVAAEASGPAANTASGAVLTMTPQVAGFVSAVALGPLAGGANEETIEEREVRFGEYIDAVARSHVDGVRYGVRTAAITAAGVTTERVTQAEVVEPDLSDLNATDRVVKVYVHNGVGATSAALVARAQEIVNGYTDSGGNKIPGYKAAGIPCTVIAATDQAVNVTATARVAAGYSLAAIDLQVTQAIIDYIAALKPGAGVIRNEIVAAAMAVEGVTDLLPFSAPSANVTVPVTAKALPGTVNITAAN